MKIRQTEVKQTETETHTLPRAATRPLAPRRSLVAGVTRGSDFVVMVRLKVRVTQFGSWVSWSCHVSTVVWSRVAPLCVWRAAPRIEWHVSLFRQRAPLVAGWHVTHRKIFFLLRSWKLAPKNFLSSPFLTIGLDLCLWTRILASFLHESYGEFPLDEHIKISNLHSQQRVLDLRKMIKILPCKFSRSLDGKWDSKRQHLLLPSKKKSLSLDRGWRRLPAMVRWVFEWFFLPSL